MLGALPCWLLAKDRLIHASNHVAGVLLAQVAIPFDHLQGLMPQHFGDLHETGTIHGQIRCSTVPQVVKVEVSDTSTLNSSVKGVANFERSLSCGIGEDQ